MSVVRLAPSVLQKLTVFHSEFPDHLEQQLFCARIVNEEKYFCVLVPHQVVRYCKKRIGKINPFYCPRSSDEPKIAY